jgi:molybdopterin converting factor small subunit
MADTTTRSFEPRGGVRPTDRPVDRAGIPNGVSRTGTLEEMAIVRLFAAARDAAGTGREELPGDTVADVLGEARRCYGDRFDAILATCRIWVNGEPAGEHDPIGPADELAVLPPVSGGEW